MLDALQLLVSAIERPRHLQDSGSLPIRHSPFPPQSPEHDKIYELATVPFIRKRSRHQSIGAAQLERVIHGNRSRSRPIRTTGGSRGKEKDDGHDQGPARVSANGFGQRRERGESLVHHTKCQGPSNRRGIRASNSLSECRRGWRREMPTIETECGCLWMWPTPNLNEVFAEISATCWE